MMIDDVDKDFIIAIKLKSNGLHLKELDGNNSEVYKAYRECGGLCVESPRDTHYVMDGSYVIFIGNKDELLCFLNSHF